MGEGVVGIAASAGSMSDIDFKNSGCHLKL